MVQRKKYRKPETLITNSGKARTWLHGINSDPLYLLTSASQVLDLEVQIKAGSTCGTCFVCIKLCSPKKNVPSVTSNYCFQINCGQLGADLQPPLPCNFVQDPANFVTGIFAPGCMGLGTLTFGTLRKGGSEGIFLHKNNAKLNVLRSICGQFRDAAPAVSEVTMDIAKTMMPS